FALEFLLTMRRAPTSKLFPYTTLFRSRGNISIWFDPKTQWYAQSQGKQGRNQTYSDTAVQCCLMIKLLFRLSLRMVTDFVQSLRSEEHTSNSSHVSISYAVFCLKKKIE